MRKLSEYSLGTGPLKPIGFYFQWLDLIALGGIVMPCSHVRCCGTVFFAGITRVTKFRSDIAVFHGQI
jgi:hypothetical protein